MIKINIVGDFYVEVLGNHHFGKSLEQKLKEADINVVNMEGPIKTDDGQPIKKSGPSLSQDNKVPQFLESYGFDLVSLANNHTTDFGENALRLTIDSFTSAKTFGAGTFTDSYKIEVLTLKGIRIGFLGLTQYEFGIHDDAVFSKKSLGTAWFCHPLVDELIQESRNCCDYLIVMPHAGCECFDHPLPEIRTLYRHFISIGADAVIGGHPHVPQGWEFFKGKPIVYSLGNFCFDSIESSDLWYKGIMACLTINNNESISLSIELLSYDNQRKIIDLTDDDSLMAHLSYLNLILSDKEKYLCLINEKCLQMEQQYMNLFEYSGFYRPQFKRFLRLLLGMIKNKLIRRKSVYDDTHFINNLRCETHRWIISRIYELKNQ